ncbi:MAG: alpha/beta hydrolase [Tepidiformaceae bacterium]
MKNGDCNIWYDSISSGPPVVMVYGIGGNSRQWWETFPGLLAERYNLVMLDNRGTGFSDKPAAAWTMSEMTGDIQAVVDDLGLPSFHLLGCSLGSVIARHYVAERGGKQLRSLSLLCPPNGISATEADLNAALFWDRTKPLIESARGGWPIVHPEPWIERNDALLTEKFEASMKSPSPARTFQFQLAAATAADDPNPALNDYGWPVLIQHGSLDRLVPPENARTLKEAVPRARLEIIEGDSHSFWQHDPQRAAEIVLDFLDGAERLWPAN